MAYAAAEPRLVHRLISTQGLRSQMNYQRMTVRELAVACGRPSYKSTIGNLHSGARKTCSPHLARRIEEALRISPGLLFEPVLVTTRNIDSAYKGARAA